MAQMRPAICIADDDSGIRDSLRFLFEDAGYEVREARDGIEALELLASNPRPYIVLLDRMMSRLDGIKTLHRIAEMPEEVQRRIAILLLTARNEPVEPETAEFIRRHTVATVSKPFDLEALLALVRNASDQLSRLHGGA